MTSNARMYGTLDEGAVRLSALLNPKKQVLLARMYGTLGEEAVRRVVLLRPALCQTSSAEGAA